MAENHEIRISVDARQADQGLKVLDTALKRSSDNLSRFDAKARETFGNLDKVSKQTDFSRLAREAASIGSAGSSMAAQMNAAGRSVAGSFNVMASAARAAQSAFAFGNVAGATRNIIAFGRSVTQVAAQLRQLTGVTLNTNLSRAVLDLGRALAGFRAPPPASMARLASFLNQMNSFRINPSIASGLAALGAASGSFRAISGASVTNLLRLVHGLTTANPGQINAVVTALNRLSGISGINIPANLTQRLNSLQQQINQLRRGGGGGGRGGGIGGFSLGNLANLSGGFLGLQNTMNLAYQASTLLRTALGALTLGQFVTGVFEAGTQLQAFQRKIEAVSRTSADAASHFKFLDDITNRLPVPLQQAQKSYSNFVAAAQLSGQSLADVQEMFTGISEAATVFKLKPEQFENVMVAFEQMFNKGQVMSEELKRQLGQYLPAAVEIFAFSMGKSTKEFTKMMQLGQVGSENVKKFIQVYQQVFGASLAGSLMSARNQLTLFQNQWTKFQQTISSSGFDAGASGFFQALTAAAKTDDFQQMAVRIGEGFKDMFATLTVFGTMALNNIDTIAKLSAVLLGLLVGVPVLRALTSPLVLMTGAVLLLTDALGLTNTGLGNLLPNSEAARVGLYTVAGALIAVRTFGIAATASMAALGTRLLLIGGPLGLIYDGIARLTGLPEIGLFKAFEGVGEKLADELIKANPELAKTLAGMFKGRPLDKPAQDAGKTAGEKVAEGMGDSIKQALPSITTAFATLKSSMASLTAGLDSNAPIAGIRKQIAAVKESINDIMGVQKSAAEANALVQKIYEKVGFDQATKVDDLKKALQRKLDPLSVAISEYQTEIKQIEQLNKAYHAAIEMGHGGEGVGISDDTAKLMRARLDYITLKARNPFAGEVRDLKEEFEVLKQTGDQRTIEQTVLQEKNKLLAAGYIASTQELDVIREIAKARMDLERGGANGFQRWASGVKDLRESLIDVEKNGVDQLSNSLADLSVGAEVNFAKVGQSILKMFNKAIIDSLLKDIMGSFKGNSPLASIFGLKAPDPAAALAGADKAADASFNNLVTKANTANMEVQAGVVNVNGTSLGGATAAGGFGAPGTTTGFGSVPAGPQVQSYGDQNGLFPNVANTLPKDMKPGGEMPQLPTTGLTGGFSPTQFGGFFPSSTAAPATSLGTGLNLAGGSAGVSQATQLNGSMVDAIKKFEGFSAKPYGDFKQTSIGYGTKALPGETSISETDATSRLNTELSGSYSKVDSFASANNIQLPGGTRDALASLTYNSGTKWMDSGLGKNLMSGDMDAAKASFLQYNKAGGEINPGLVSRRETEASWFGTPGFGQQPGQSGASSFDTQGFINPQTNGPSVADQFQQTSVSAATATADLGNLNTGIDTVGTQAMSTVPQFSAFGDSLSGLFKNVGQFPSFGGFGGMGGGGGDLLGAGAGLFKEGGLSTSPVSSYASGTEMARRSAGTGHALNGGFPAILHDNEAVIPLTRGREVPVVMNGNNDKGGDAGGGSTFVMHLHGVTDYDSFKKSRSQVKSDMASMQTLAAQKNN